MEIYKILLRETVLDRADRVVEFEIPGIDLRKRGRVFCPNLLFDIGDIINIENAVYGEHVMNIVRERTPQPALRWLSHCWKVGFRRKTQEKRFPAIMH